ncbi:MAG: single-stranded DNA-binding protein [bacterium]|nr:single-stranded DNA-binding protein [bacterium]
MYNKVFLIGRLVRDPETRVTSSGITVTKFTIAIDRFSKKADTENNADFIRVVTWRKLAEICGDYLNKGKLIAVEGRLQTDSYEKNGETIEVSEVIADNVQMLDKRRQASEEDSAAPS